MRVFTTHRRFHGLVSLHVLGLIAGVIARIILPGRQRGGWILTLILGKPTEFWSLYSWIVAIVGALIVIGLANLIFRPKRA